MNEAARRFVALGFKILATAGTHRDLEKAGIPSEVVQKIREGQPSILDVLKSGEVQLVINTPSGKLSKVDDSYIRKEAIRLRIPYITTLAAALAASKGIEAKRHGQEGVKSIQEYHHHSSSIK